MEPDKELELDTLNETHELERLMVDDAPANVATTRRAPSGPSMIRGAGVGAILRWLLFVLRDAARTVLRPSESNPERGIVGKVFGYPPPKLDPSRETAWLDGLRGVAASLVMIYHYNLAIFGTLTEAPYGAVEGLEWQIWRLPFLRVIMSSGHTQVSTFFVLSGFVLSWSTLNHIRHGRLEKFATSLSSSVFRRWLRLFMPCWIIGIISFFEVRMGIMDLNMDMSASIFVQFWDYLKACEQFANPFRLDRGPYGSLFKYNWTFWTIPYEFAGSLMVFMILLGVGRMKNYMKRTVVIGSVCFYAFYSAQWNYWLFITGVLLADYVREYGGFERLSNSLTSRQRGFWYFILVIGLLLAGVPERNVAYYPRPGYEALMAITPQKWMEHEGGQRLWWCLAGILILTALCHMPLRKIFERPFVRYLGKISFMLYLTHRTVYDFVGFAYRKQLNYLLGTRRYSEEYKMELWLIEGHFTMVLYYVLFWVGMLPLALATANWSEVVADAPSVRFARWVDDKFIKGFTPSDSVNPASEESTRLPT